jgi:hypothetical protein
MLKCKECDVALGALTIKAKNKAKFKKLTEQLEQLQAKKEAIREKHDRPTKWMKDPEYRTVCAKIRTVGAEIVALIERN